MKALYLTQHFKNADEIHLPLVNRPIPKPKESECLVEIHSSGVNPSDVLGTLGYFPLAQLPRIPGRDFAGIVVGGKFEGKKIWGTGGAVGLESDGSHAEFMVIPDTAIAEIPNNLSLLEAGAQTLPYVTAYYALVTRAQIKAGDTVLVIGALGQVGHAAMSICQWKGCRTVALVRSDLQKAKNLYGEAYQEIPSSLSFDVILNTIGNLNWDQHLLSLNNFGRMVVIAASEGKRDVQINLLDLYRKNQNILGINSVDLDFTQSAFILNALKEGFSTGALSPLPIDSEAIFPLEKASDAYKMVYQGSKSKRVVLKIKK